MNLKRAQALFILSFKQRLRMVLWCLVLKATTVKKLQL